MALFRCGGAVSEPSFKDFEGQTSVTSANVEVGKKYLLIIKGGNLTGCNQDFNWQITDSGTVLGYFIEVTATATTITATQGMKIAEAIEGFDTSLFTGLT